MIPDYLVVSNGSTRILKRGSQKRVGERDVTMETGPWECRVAGFENGERGHEPRTVGSLQKGEKARKWVLF